MADENQREHGGKDVAGLGAWAAVAVRQAQELWPDAQRNPELAELRLVIEQLATVERLLPADDPAKAAVVPWLGLLMWARLKGGRRTDPKEWEAAVSHLRATDRVMPLNDPLAMTARRNLAELLTPPDLRRAVRQGSWPPAVVEMLRRQLTEAINVLARIVAGDLSTRERMIAEMEQLATLLSLLPAPPGEVHSGGPVGPVGSVGPGESVPSVESVEPAVSAVSVEETLADAVQELVDWARRDAVGFARLLEWLCVALSDAGRSMADAGRQLADLGLDQPEFTPLRELLVALTSDGQDPRSLAERVRGTAQATREVLLGLPAEAPERIRVAKFHAALLVAGNLRAPQTLDFAEVDEAVIRPDPDRAARALWRRPVSMEMVLTTLIDNLWVSNGEIARVEQSAVWLRKQIDDLPADGARAAAARRWLSTALAHRVATAAWLGGSLQDDTAALSMAKGLPATDERDIFPTMFGLLARFRVAHRSGDRAATAHVADDMIGTLSDRHDSPALDVGARLILTALLGLAHSDRAGRTGDQADRRAAGRYLREVVDADPATVPTPFAPFFPVTRAELMTELARVDPRREVIDRAVAEVHRVIEESRPSPWDEARLRLVLGRAMLRATTHRSDLSLLDPCIAELSRARALAAGGSSLPMNIEALTELSKAYWTSVATGGGRASEDRKASLETRREALELMAADVLLQLGAEHALSVTRAATGHVLWLALRYVEDRRPAEAVEALELGRALVLQTAAAAHGVPRLLADQGHSDLAERWRVQVPEHPLQRGPHEGDAAEGDTAEGHPAEGDPLRPEGAVVVPAPASGAGLPSSLRREALAALGAGNGTGARELLGTPDAAALTAALAASGADALVYLVPGEGFRPHIPGHALILRPGGAEPSVVTLPLLLSPGSHQLERYLTAAADRSREAADPDTSRASREVTETEWRAALSELCDWAWPAAVGPVLDSLEPLGRPPRIVLIPCGPLGVVPWHAARKHIPLGGHRYACEDAVFSYAPSGAQFLRAAARDRLPGTGLRVLVTDPRLSLIWAEIETEALRSACYPDARRYGEFVAAEGVPDAPGSCDDLLAVLPGGDRPASVVHVSCHGVAGPSPTRSALSLADGELTVARILDHPAAAAPGPDGPLVVLSACETDLSTGDHDEALTLSTALVARGAADVVGSRWAVNDSATALMMAAFHHFLTSQEFAPSDALRAAQVWMLDPDREAPPGLGDQLRRDAARADLHEIHLWAAFTHQGNPAAR